MDTSLEQPGLAVKLQLVVTLPLALAASSAFAASVTPLTYEMLNGNSATYTYFDDLYTGSGCKTCDNALLTGGLGDLTDGVVATQNWQVVEAPAGAGPYVGWVNLDPSITFHFGQSVNISSVTFSFDDSQFGGVVAPSSIKIGQQTFAVTDPAGSSPFNFTVTGLGFTGSDLTVTVNRNGQWVFLSEVSFQSPVPESSTAAMLLAGLASMFWLTRHRRMPN